MYVNVLKGIEKVRRNAELVHKFQKGVFSHDGGVTLLDSAWYSAVITAFVIQLVSLFDDALENYIAAHSPDFKGRTLSHRIDYLVDAGVLSDRQALDWLRERRNQLAHEAGITATWTDWERAIQTVRMHLPEIGAVPNSLDRPAVNERFIAIALNAVRREDAPS